MNQEPLVISFYTEGTPYQLEVFNLCRSIRQWDIEAEVDGIPSRGTWENNCAFKPFFIHQKLKEKKRPVFWVDADARFKKKPDFSFLKNAHVSFREKEDLKHLKHFRYCAGSLFVNYSPEGIAFVEEWCVACTRIVENAGEAVPFLDQITLADLAEQMTVHPLPVSYCKIFDLDSELIADEEVVVEHYQASRRFKRLSLKMGEIFDSRSP